MDDSKIQYEINIAMLVGVILAIAAVWMAGDFDMLDHIIENFQRFR